MKHITFRRILALLCCVSMLALLVACDRADDEITLGTGDSTDALSDGTSTAEDSTTVPSEDGTTGSVEQPTEPERDNGLIPLRILEEDLQAHLWDPMEAAVAEGRLDADVLDRLKDKWIKLDFQPTDDQDPDKWLACFYPYLVDMAYQDEDGNTQYPTVYIFKHYNYYNGKVWIDSSNELISEYTDYTAEQLAADHARVWYTPGTDPMGTDEWLIPKLILAEDFETHILAPLQAAMETDQYVKRSYDSFLAYWELIDVNLANDALLEEYLTVDYPFLQQYGMNSLTGRTEYPRFYRLRYWDSSEAWDTRRDWATSGWLNVEYLIRTYTDYTAEQLAADHARIGYVPSDLLPQRRQLLPKLILAEDFESSILNPLKEAYERGDITEFQYAQFKNAWIKKDVNLEKEMIRVELVNRQYQFLKALGERNEAGTIIYPVFYDINAQVSNAELCRFESMIIQYTDYTFAQMAADHARVDYTDYGS